MNANLHGEFAADFLEEAKEMLGKWERYTNILKNGMDRTKLDALYRFAHTLKGSARAVGLDDFARLSELAEDIIKILRENQWVFRSEYVGILFFTQKCLVEWHSALRAANQNGESTTFGLLRGRLERLKKAMSSGDLDSVLDVLGEHAPLAKVIRLRPDLGKDPPLKPAEKKMAKIAHSK